MSTRLWTKSEDAALLKLAPTCANTEDVQAKIQAARPGTTFGAARCRYELLTGKSIRSVFTRKKEQLSPVERAEKKDRLADLARENEQLLAETRALRAQLHAMGIMKEQAPLRPVEAKKAGKHKTRQGVPVLLISDLHVEEPVKPELVNGMNEYNLTIAERCIERAFEGFLWLSKDSRFDCRTAVVKLMGDLFSGYIHEELLESNFLSPIKASLWLQPRIEKGLRQVKQHFDRVIVECVDGNHGRTTKRIRAATRTANSYEWLLYHNLAARMSDEKGIEFQIAEGQYSYLKVFDTTMMTFHGDSVNYQGGIGGVTIPMQKHLDRLRKYEQSFDFACFGHFHTSIDLPGFVGNGSAIGITPWTLSRGFNPEPRQQRFFMIDSTRGKCLSAPIWL
jgi:hypothetical protein